MNKFDEKYIFRLANMDDIDKIMEFYRTEWSSTHILATDKEYFCYQHVVNSNVNFMLAIDKNTGAIHAAEGFIQYSLNLKDIAAVMLKSSKNAVMPFLGVEVIKRLKEATKCRVYLGPGANPVTSMPLHKNILKHYVGKLDHFYYLSDREEYKIAVIKAKRETECSASSEQYKLIKINALIELENKYDFERDILRKPYKDSWYVEKRYFKNPIYTYSVWGIENKLKIVGLLIAREIEYNSSKVLRIVDYLGNTTALSGLGNEIKKLIKENNYEYIDIYCKGIDKKILTDSGFILKDDEDKNIIPNYFEPLVQENIDIWYAVSDEETILFKGDGDQDRPNRRI